jgi:hypothetical protein
LQPSNERQKLNRAAEPWTDQHHEDSCRRLRLALDKFDKNYLKPLVGAYNSTALMRCEEIIP